MSSPTRAQQAYVRKVELFGYELGLPKSMGRVLGWLVICEPARQNAEDIQRALKLSSGSVSNALTMLTRVGLVQRLRRPGERRLYYELQGSAWEQTFQHRLLLIRRMRELAEEGLGLAPSNQRLEKMRAFYTWAETEFSKLIEKAGH